MTIGSIAVRPSNSSAARSERVSGDVPAARPNPPSAEVPLDLTSPAGAAGLAARLLGNAGQSIAAHRFLPSAGSEIGLAANFYGEVAAENVAAVRSLFTVI